MALTQIMKFSGSPGSLMGGASKNLGGLWVDNSRLPGGAGNEFDMGATGAGGGPSLGRLRSIAELNKENYIGQAASDMQTQGDLALASQNRRLQEMGVNPSAGRYVASGRQAAIDLAASKAAAMTRAGRWVDEENFNRLSRLAELERANQAQAFNQKMSISNFQAQQQAQSQAQSQWQQQMQMNERNARNALKSYEKSPQGQLANLKAMNELKSYMGSSGSSPALTFTQKRNKGIAGGFTMKPWN